MDTTKQPETLQEALVYFSNPDVALAFMVKMIWPDGVVCPHCGGADPTFLKTRRIWKCKACREQFSIKAGTIMEDSPLGLDKWLAATWLIANAKNGISSYEIHRGIGVTQKTAWFLLQRIRLAMTQGSFKKFAGMVEADETFIGGAARNMHKGKRKAKGSGTIGKAIVAGILERGPECSRVKVNILQSTRRPHVQEFVRANVEDGSNVMTDALASYDGLEDKYVHEAVNHAVCYVRDHVHTNGLENFWSLLKRTLDGTYVAVEPFHLFRYLDEQTFRFNNRKVDDAERFGRVLRSISGKRLTYRQLIGETGAVSSSASDGVAESASKGDTHGGQTTHN